MEKTPAYHPMPLRTLAEIMAAFGVSREAVARWADEGAPIIRERGYSAEYMDLHRWRLARQHALK